jgi:hypothetical protein
VAEQLDPAVEQQLADMSDQDWRSLSARVRPPTSSEQLKSIAAKHINEDQLPTFMAIANVKAFADEHGNIEEAKVQTHAARLFGAVEPQQQGTPANYGQGTGQPPARQPGDDARSALAKRHGVKSNNDQPGAGAGIQPGVDGRAAAAKRHGGNRK